MINKVILIGNVGKEPVIRESEKGVLASLSIATSEHWKDKNTGERKEATEWHNVVIYNPALCGYIKNYIVKGSKVYVEGKLKTRKWQDKQGQDKYTTEVVLSGYEANFKNLSPKTSESTQESPEVENDVEDDIPF